MQTCRPHGRQAGCMPHSQIVPNHPNLGMVHNLALAIAIYPEFRNYNHEKAR
jgi:hypothetical protein